MVLPPFKESGNRAWDTAYFQIDLESQQGNVEAIRSIVKSHPVFLRRACNTLANMVRGCYDVLGPPPHPPDLFMRTLEALLDVYEPNRDSEALKPLTSDSRMTQLALKDPRLGWRSRLCLLHAYASSSQNIGSLTWFPEAANEVVVSVLQLSGSALPPTDRLWRVCSALVDEQALDEETRGRLSLLTTGGANEEINLDTFWLFRKSTPQSTVQSLLRRIISKPQLMGRDWARTIAVAAEITRDASSLVNLFHAVLSSPVVKGASWIQVASSVLSNASSLSSSFNQTSNGRVGDGIGIRHAIVAFVEDRIVHGEGLKEEMEIVDLRCLLDRTGVDPVDIFLRIASRFSPQSRTLNNSPPRFPRGGASRGRAVSLALSALSPPLHGHLQRLWATRGAFSAFELFVAASESSESSLQVQAEDWLIKHLSSSDLQSESIMRALVQSIPYLSKQILEMIRNAISKIDGNMGIELKEVMKIVNDYLSITSVSDKSEEMHLIQAAETVLLKVSSEKGRSGTRSDFDDNSSRKLCKLCWSLLRFCSCRDHPEAALLLGRLLNFLSESVKASLRMWLVPPPPYLMNDDEMAPLNPVRLKVCLHNLLPSGRYPSKRPSSGYVPDVWAISEAIVRTVNLRLRAISDTDAVKKGEEVAGILLGVKKWLPWEPFSQSLGSLTRKGSRFQAIIMCRLLCSVWGEQEDSKPLLAAFPERHGLLFPTTKAVVHNVGGSDNLDDDAAISTSSSSYAADGNDNGHCISSTGDNDRFSDSAHVNKPNPDQHAPFWMELVELWFNPPPGCCVLRQDHTSLSSKQQQFIPPSCSISVAASAWLLRERLQTAMCLRRLQSCPKWCSKWLKLNVEKGTQDKNNHSAAVVQKEPAVYFSGKDVFLSEVNGVCLPPWVEILLFFMQSDGGGGTRNNNKTDIWELWLVLSRLADAYCKKEFNGSAEKLISAWLVALTRGGKKTDDESSPGISFSVMVECFIRAIRHWGRTTRAENGLWLPRALLVATASEDFEMRRLNAIMDRLEEGQDSIVLEGDSKAMTLVVESTLRATCKWNGDDCDDSACRLLLLTCIMRFVSVQFRAGLHPESSQALLECLKRESRGPVRSILQRRAVAAEWHVAVDALMDADASESRDVETKIRDVGTKRSIVGDDLSQQGELRRTRMRIK